MIVQPRIRGFICTTAHPAGCFQNVQEQIDFVQKKGKIANGPKRVLVVGASNGYGLASRITAAFACGSQTIGVFFERESENGKTATAGWYNSVGFEVKAKELGLYAKSFNGDAFSDEMKMKVIETIKKDWGKVDLLIYSLASPRRQHPRTGLLAKSVLKPIGAGYTNKSLDMEKCQLETVTLNAATDEEINQTVSVMGGEDWEFWVDALEKENLLAENFTTVAYSYIGPEVTRSIYRNGTIGRAKDHLEATSNKLDQRLKSKHGRSFISVNKALVTQSSSAIPFIPLYFVLLKKVMRSKGLDEDCIQQMHRLFKDRLYGTEKVLTDESGFIRMDDWEMKPDVQKEVQNAWEKIDNSNLKLYSDMEGYQQDFLKLFGFGVPSVDYSADVKVDLKLPSGS